MRVETRFVGLDEEGRVVEEKVVKPDGEPEGDSFARATGKLLGGVIAVGSLALIAAFFAGAAAAVAVTAYHLVRNFLG